MFPYFWSDSKCFTARSTWMVTFPNVHQSVWLNPFSVQKFLHKTNKDYICSHNDPQLYVFLFPWIKDVLSQNLHGWCCLSRDCSCLLSLSSFSTQQVPQKNLHLNIWNITWGLCLSTICLLIFHLVLFWNNRKVLTVWLWKQTSLSEFFVTFLATTGNFCSRQNSQSVIILTRHPEISRGQGQGFKDFHNIYQNKK